LSAAGRWEAQWGGFNSIDAIHVLSESDIWAAGSSLIHFDGSAWKEVGGEEVPQSIAALDIAPDGSGWAVGSAGALRGSSTGFAIPFTANSPGLPVPLHGYRPRDVAALDRDHAWLLAEDEASRRDVLMSWQGAEWRAMWSPPEPSSLTALWLTSPSEGWVVGRDGFIARFDGATWAESYSPTSIDLADVGGSGPNDVWAVGGHSGGFGEESSRVAMHFDGREWLVVLESARAPLTDLAFAGNAGYVIAADGEVQRADGGRWSPLAGRFNTLFPFN
jgi:hypothetical protein